MQKNSGNIKVYCRFRPFNQKQLSNRAQKLHRIANNKTQLIIKDSSKKQSQKIDEISFMYDYVFDIDSTQEQVYQKVGLPVLENIIQGFNGTIMAYGQTSSGKTHTMQGYDINDKQIKGIMPRIVQIEKLFTAIERSTQSIEYKLKISIFELYMQKVRDLLDVSKNDLKIRQNKAGPYIQNLTQVYVGDKGELFKLINLGQKNRITCSTNMNEHSSRSHMIFLLSLNQFNNQDSSSKTSKLYLIDLAGSEKISKTGAEGKVLQEAKKINLSLTNLGKVIKNLAQRSNFIPYRDSKLTRILKDSLGGNSKTTLIVTCSPHQMHLPETVSTLRFGENAQKIKNKPKINKQLTVQELQKIVEKFEDDIKVKDLKIEFLQKYIKEKLNAELPNYKEIQIFTGLKLNEINNHEEVQNAKQTSPTESTTQRSKVTQQQQQSQIMLLEQDQVAQSLLQVKTNLKTKHQLEQRQKQQYYSSRISQLQLQLSNFRIMIQKQVEKYYQLKKQYNELHENLSSILKENMQLQQQKYQLLNEKTEIEHKLTSLEYEKSMVQMEKNKIDKQNDEHESELENVLIENNSTLIKMILGEIFTIVGPCQQQEIKKMIQSDHWYKKIMSDNVNCSDFYEIQKQKLNQQIRQFTKEKKMFLKELELQGENKNEKIDRMTIALLEQTRMEKQKQNQKILLLENKLDKLFDQYHQMINLQTTWKVECQLYQRKLKKKQQKIHELEEILQQLQEQIMYLQGTNAYDDYEDTKSVKSKIVKPLKGGFLFK